MSDWFNIRFEDINGSYDFWGDNFVKVPGDLVPIYNQCIDDAIEYFDKTLNIGYSIKSETVRRQKLTPEQKERIFEFLKSRAKHYGEHGLLL